MYLAIALVLIFVLWLIDKHNQWRAAAKIFLGFVGLAVLGLGACGGGANTRTGSMRSSRRLIAAEHEGAVKACVKRFSAQGVFDTAPCELDPSAQPQPPQPPVVFEPSPTVPIPRAKSAHVKRVKNKGDFDVRMTTTEYGDLTCGMIKAGEIVTLLVDDGLSVKVRTNEGKIGWALAAYFDVAE